MKINIINRELETQPSEVIKKDFINPRWASKIYTAGFFNKLLYKLSKIFFFLKKINFLKKIVEKIKHKIIIIKLNKKLKKYFE